MLCQRVGCPQSASHAIKICVPGLAFPDEAPPCAAVTMHVCLCATHVDDADAAAFLEDQGLVGVLRMSSRDAIDLDRAYIVGVSMASEEYRDLAAKESELRIH